jgi:hypothetical protein
VGDLGIGINKYEDTDIKDFASFNNEQIARFEKIIEEKKNDKF